MFKEIQYLQVGDEFKIHSADHTSFTYLGQRQIGGVGDDVMIEVYVRPSWTDFGKSSLVTYANLPVPLVRRNSFRKVS